MSALEVAHWAEFEADFGPLTLHERLDAVIQAQTGEKVKWFKPKPLTEAEIWAWLDAEAKR